MPDITMCQNKTCTKRETCYRYRAVPSDISQSYSSFYDVHGFCKYFLIINEGAPVVDMRLIEGVDS